MMDLSLSNPGIEALSLHFDAPLIAGARKLTVLSELGVGRSGIVENLDLPEEVQHHLMHMGFVPEARVITLRRAPAGDPTVYGIDGLEIALRHETARSIHIRFLPDDDEGTE
jgi:Fe2+ transport system protein FeoA